MQCEHKYHTETMFAPQCHEHATHTVRFSYRNGAVVRIESLCDLHARIDTDNLNLWGGRFGHKAEIQPDIF